MSSRILAIDYGTRRVGLALSDPTRTLATGLPTLERRAGDRLADAVERLARQHEAGEILIGLPVNMDGTRGPRAAQVEQFAGLLRERLDVPVTLWDERLSTVRAYRVLRETGTRMRRARTRVDQVSAILILQSYLDSLRAQER